MGRFDAAVAKTIQEHGIAADVMGMVSEYLRSGDAGLLARLQGVKYGEWAWMRLIRALPSPACLDDESRRLIPVFTKQYRDMMLLEWLESHLAREKPGEDVLTPFRQEMLAAGMAPERLAELVGYSTRWLSRGRPNSLGRERLEAPDDAFRAGVVKEATSMAGLAGLHFYLTHGRERIPRFADDIVEASLTCRSAHSRELFAALMCYPDLFAEALAKGVRSSSELYHAYRAATVLAEHDPGRHTELAADVSRRWIRAGEVSDNALWLLKHEGFKALPDIVEGVAMMQQIGKRGADERLPAAMADAAGPAALPILVTLSETSKHGKLHTAIATQLVRLDDGTHRDLILSLLRDGMQGRTRFVDVSAYAMLAVRWDAAALHDDLWALLEREERDAQAAGVSALTTLGEEVLPRAQMLLAHERSSVRASAAELIAAAGTHAALDVLEARLPLEPAGEAREVMLRALGEAWARGVTPTPAALLARAAAVLPYARRPSAKWLAKLRLPQLRYVDGTGVPEDVVRLLFARQSACRAVAPATELAPIYALIDRSSAGPFALVLAQGFLGKADTADLWALVVACVLGDDRLVSLLRGQLAGWADSTRYQLAVTGVQALAQLSTDAALMTVDAMALRHATRRPSIGAAARDAFAAAAQRRGMSVDELADRVVPWLGFAHGAPRILDCGRPVEARIGMDFRLIYTDVATGKRIASLPSGTPAALKDEMKLLGTLLRNAAKAQMQRMEDLLARQHRWPAGRWRELFLAHPLLVPFGVRLVWGAYRDGALTATFRVLEDGSLTDCADTAVTLADDMLVGIVHPLELPAEQREAWVAHLADYELEPPFAQMTRPVLRPSADDVGRRASDAFTDLAINAMTFRGRSERLGWRAGAMADGGSIPHFRRAFPAHGVAAYIGLEGMAHDVGRFGDISLKTVFFARDEGTEPGDISDPRVLVLGAVPPIVYSEAMGDLRRITDAMGEEEV